MNIKGTVGHCWSLGELWQAGGSLAVRGAPWEAVWHFERFEGIMGGSRVFKGIMGALRGPADTVGVEGREIMGVWGHYGRHCGMLGDQQLAGGPGGRNPRQGSSPQPHGWEPLVYIISHRQCFSYGRHFISVAHQLGKPI